MDRSGSDNDSFSKAYFTYVLCKFNTILHCSTGCQEFIKIRVISAAYNELYIFAHNLGSVHTVSTQSLNVRASTSSNQECLTPLIITISSVLFVTFDIISCVSITTTSSMESTLNHVSSSYLAISCCRKQNLKKTGLPPDDKRNITISSTSTSLCSDLTQMKTHFCR